MYTRSRLSWIKHTDFILIDLLCLQAAYLAAYYLRFPNAAMPYSVDVYRNIIIVFSLFQVVVSLMLDSHKDILKRGIYQELVSVVLLSLFSLGLVSLYLYSSHIGEIYSRLLIYYTVGIFAVLDFICRLLRKKIVISRLQKKAKDKQNARRVFVYTNALGKDEIVAALEEDIADVFTIEGITVTDDAASPIRPEDAPQHICREWIDEVFVYLPGEAAEPKEFLNSCMEMGVTVHIMLDMGNVTKEKQTIESLGGNTVLTVAYSYIAPHQAVVKRLMDIFGGLVGSVFTVLIGLVIGPMIYCNSPGPILFKQERVGKNGKKFNVLKFRSMYPDAEERKKALMKENRNADGMMFKLDFDPRIIGNKILPDGTKKTGIGEFIRKTSLDEFPQFFNVLKGDMSLVGTRPPTLDEWEKYEYHHRARLAVKPGITGMWQVSGRSKITDFEEVVRLDTEYITNYRLSLDLKILWKTILVVLEGNGAM